MWKRLRQIYTYAIDPQSLIVIALSSFLFVGIEYLDFHISWLEAVTTLVTAALTEIVFSFLSRRSLAFPRSALSAGLGLCIFFRAFDLYFFALAAFVAIASKYVLRKPVGGHIFNPSNFAIVSLAFLFPSDVTIEFTQWGNDPYVWASIAAVSLFVAYRAGALRTTLSFFAAYIGLLLVLFPYVPEILQAHHYGLLNPTLILFGAFMITDPRTSPQGSRERVLHGATIALAYYALEYLGIRYALFLASFLVTIANFCSGYLPHSFGSRLLQARNAATFLISCSIAVFLFIPSWSESARFLPWRMAPSYLLLGIDSDRLMRCSDDPTFRATETALSETGGTVGVAWGDYNNDGFDDVFVSNVDGSVGSRLFHNNGDGTFNDVTEKAGIRNVYSASAFFVDYDNDGLLDIFITYPEDAPYLESKTLQSMAGSAQPLLVYKNLGRRFVDVTAAVGLNTPAPNSFGATLTFGDYDRDGDLDFLLSAPGYLYRPEGHIAFQKANLDPFFNETRILECDSENVRQILATIRGDDASDLFALQKARGMCVIGNGPIALSNSGPADVTMLPILERGTYWLATSPGSLHLFENRNGWFSERADFSEYAASIVLSEGRVGLTEAEYPFSTVSGRFWQPISFDYDADGWTDILVATDFGRSLLFKNMGGLRFRDVAEDADLDHSGSGMGVDVADMDADGILDAVVTNVHGDFVLVGTAGGFRKAEDISPLGIGWGVAFLDHDLDADPDVVITNGVFSKSVAENYHGSAIRAFATGDRLYRNEQASLRDATWDDLCPVVGSGLGLAVSDFDNSGTPDVFVGNISSHSDLRNALYSSYAEHSYIKVRLQGDRDNSFGIGSIVTVTSNDRTQTRLVTAGASFYSQNSSRLVFGLGADDSPVDIRVVWPSGEVTNVSEVAVNQEVVVRQR